VKIIRKILFYFNVLLVLITLLAYISPFVDPAHIWVLPFLGLIFPILLVLNLLFVFYWLISKWKNAWLSILCLILGANYIGHTISFSAPKKVENPDFSIASYNMNYAYGTYQTGTYRYDIEKSSSFSSFIKKELKADILCAQEANKRINDLINDHFSYQFVPPETGTSIYSQYPLVNAGQFNFGTRTNSCVWADIVIKKDTVRIYSAHLQSNKISSETEKVLSEAEKTQKLNFSNIRAILGKYRRYAGIRSKQANMINDHMDNSPYPVILCGDFNDPPVSYTHRVLTQKRQDAFTVAGYGLGRTYAGKIPMLRIDNIILSNDFIVESHQTLYKKLSDH